MSDTRTSISNALDVFAAVGLKLGAVATGLGFVYLMYMIFGPQLDAMKTMKPAELASINQSVSWSRIMLVYGSALLVLSLCIRLFYEETIGLILVLVGAGLYFMAPKGLAGMTTSGAAKTATGKVDPGALLCNGIVHDITLVGLFCLIPGCLLLVRDIVWRITKRLNAKPAPQTEMEKARAERLAKRRKPYEMCWDMSVCNERAKRFCPAWEKHKPCWQVKSGCLCDQTIMRQALLERDKEEGRGQKTAAPDTMPKVIMTAKQKKERCRNCSMYMDHQQQKFKIATPVSLVLVGVLYAVLYKQIYNAFYSFFKGMDHFMKFLTYHKGSTESFSAQGNSVTILGMICLGVVVLSVTFRLVEWMIFDRKL